ncbi:MAG: aldolase/citrate lyase family protein [Candidatus Brocadiaceae bacterium]|nr:aldolase/citrate lyase family protein [Candidatus Brocadiaceae bacterium]
MNSKNQLKKRLKNGEIVFGPWCIIPSPTVTNIIATTGMDFVIFDLEHGSISYETLENMICSAESEDCCPLVRVGQRDELQILRSLDLGAHGVLVPHVQNKKEAEEAVSFIKYYPEGQRGFSPYTRAGGYSLIGVKDHAKNQNQQTLVALILENKDCLDKIEEILDIRNVDLIYIGAYDLSQSLGVPGQLNNPKVRECVERSVRKIRDNGVAAGGYVAKNVEDIRWMTDIGMQFITYLPDVTTIFHSFHDASNMFKSVIDKRIADI